MGTLMVGYDLNKPNKDYDPLIKQLKEGYGDWWHHLDSTWLIKTTKSAKAVRDELKSYIDDDDELVVINVTDDARAWTGFNASGSKWLKATF